MYFGNQFACYNIISVTTKRFLKTQLFEKKANFSVKKILWPIFFALIIEHGKHQGALYKGPEGKLTDIVQVIR